MIAGPAFYAKAEKWLGTYGWEGLVIGSAIVIGVTLWLLLTHNAVLLTGWLVYLYSP